MYWLGRRAAFSPLFLKSGSPILKSSSNWKCNWKFDYGYKLWLFSHSPFTESTWTQSHRSKFWNRATINTFTVFNRQKVWSGSDRTCHSNSSFILICMSILLVRMMDHFSPSCSLSRRAPPQYWNVVAIKNAAESFIVDINSHFLAEAPAPAQQVMRVVVVVLVVVLDTKFNFTF